MEPKKLPTASEILLANLKPNEPQPEPVAAPSTPEPTPVPDKVIEPVAANPEPPKPEPGNVDDWDTTPPEPQAEPKFDFNSWVKDTGIEAKDEVEFKEKIRKLKDIPAPVDVLDGVDERLKKAVELSKRGGDYLTYLGIQKVDYSKIDPVDLYKTSILSNKTFSPEEAKELLESLSPLQMKERGIQLQNEYTRWQNAQIAEFEAGVQSAEKLRAERKVNADRELRSTLDKVDKIAGLTLKPHHKQDIFDAITTGRMQRELFYDSKSGDYDYQSMIETYFVKKNLPKILDHVKKITSSETLRDHMRQTQNVNLDGSREKPEPQAAPTPDPLMDFVNRSRTSGARR